MTCRAWRAAALVFAALLLAACGRHGDSSDATASAPLLTAPDGLPMDAQRVLNVYNWSDYIDPTVVPGFEKEYGIKVNYDVFDSNEVVETKLLSGHTGYDVVVPSASFLQRQIQAGVFQKLDKSLLPNLKNLDPTISRIIQVHDPGNQYAVNYLWGTSGIGYNEAKVLQAMPDAPVDSFAMFYDPEVIKHFKSCGVSMLDAPDEMVGTVLIYLGKNPNSESLDDLKAAERVLLSIRPYIRYINSSRYIDDLANGGLCLALGWSGDVGQSRARAEEDGKGITIKYNIAKEGAIMFFDMLAIPADAPHPHNAHLFINYLLRPEVAARNSAKMHYATSNAAAYSLVDKAVYNDHGIYPTEAQKAHMYPNASHSIAYTRMLNRTWTRFKTGQ
ncbi:MAG TPA: polyamine ABC transporter substrate-binding protein [Rhodanobacter sp.]|jgi:putrescine transport system substrate-binding protein